MFDKVVYRHPEPEDSNGGPILDSVQAALRSFRTSDGPAVDPVRETEILQTVNSLALPEDVEQLARFLLRTWKTNKHTINPNLAEIVFGEVVERLLNDNSPEHQLIRDLLKEVKGLNRRGNHKDEYRNAVLKLKEGILREQESPPRYDLALRFYTEACNYLVDIGREKGRENHPLLLSCLIPKVRIFLKRGEQDKALGLLNESVARILDDAATQRSKDVLRYAPYLSTAHSFFGNVLLNTLNSAPTPDDRARIIRQAYSHFERAAAFGQYLGDSREKFEALYGLARIEAREDGEYFNLWDAIQYGEKALRSLESAYGDKKKPASYEAAAKFVQDLHLKRGLEQ